MADRPPLRRLNTPAARAYDALLKDWPDSNIEAPWARVLQALEDCERETRQELRELRVAAAAWSALVPPEDQERLLATRWDRRSAGFAQASGILNALRAAGEGLQSEGGE